MVTMDVFFKSNEVRVFLNFSLFLQKENCPMLPTSSYTTLTVRYGADDAQLPWSSRHKAIDVAKNLVQLHTPELSAWLGSRFGGSSTAASQSQAVPYKTFVEVGSGASSFVCADIQQLEMSLGVVNGTATSNNATVEVVVLAALSFSADGRPQFQKLYRTDVQLLNGALDVVLSTSGEVVGRLPFDKARPSTLTELEDGVDELPWVVRWKRSITDQKLLAVDIGLGWRVQTSNGKAPAQVMRIDGDADTRALANDVRVYGHDHVVIVLNLPDLRPEDGAMASGPSLRQQAELQQTARKVLNKNVAPVQRPGSAAATRAAPEVTTPQQSNLTAGASPTTLRSGRKRPQSATPMSSLGSSSAAASGGGGKTKSVRPGTTHEVELFDHVDDDVDYISISYVLNPPEITIVGFLEDTQLQALSENIIKKCVSEGRVAALRTGPPTFLRMVQNVGVFPSYRMTMSKWYFDEVQELSLILAILDAVSELDVFRYVPLDGMCEKSSADSIYEQRMRSRTMLSMGNARATLGGGEVHQAAAKRSQQFLFMPK